MKEIKAFRCELTGEIFEDEARAKKSEFRTMMKRVGGQLPSFGSVNSTNIMEWLADNITSEIYPSVADRLSKALAYYAENIRRPAPPLDEALLGVAPQKDEDAA